MVNNFYKKAAWTPNLDTKDADRVLYDPTSPTTRYKNPGDPESFNLLKIENMQIRLDILKSSSDLEKKVINKLKRDKEFLTGELERSNILYNLLDKRYKDLKFEYDKGQTQISDISKLIQMKDTELSESRRIIDQKDLELSELKDKNSILESKNMGVLITDNHDSAIIAAATPVVAASASVVDLVDLRDINYKRSKCCYCGKHKKPHKLECEHCKREIDRIRNTKPKRLKTSVGRRIYVEEHLGLKLKYYDDK